MASTAPEIPIVLMRKDAKYRVIEWIRGLGLPSRFARKLLQDWAGAVEVDLNPTDYDLVSSTGKGVSL